MIDCRRLQTPPVPHIRFKYHSNSLILQRINMAKNRCARLYGMKDLRIEDLPIPEPKAGYVQVKPAFVGMCRSDLHFYDEGYIEGYVVEEPLVLGHEISAVVSKLGQGVTGLKVGDRVMVDPNMPCYKCRFCQDNRVEICEKVTISGIPSTDGGFANYMLTLAANCHKIPEQLCMEEAACAEPLSVGCWALQRGRLERGDVVVVFGMGPVGLLTFQAARAKGASKTLVVDTNSERLELAKSLGADITYLVTPPDMEDPKALATTIKSLLGSEADLCVECSGAPGTVDTAILLCRKAGRVVMVGFGEAKLNVHLGVAAIREVDVLGSVCNNGNFPECVELLGSGKVKAAPLITNKIPLEHTKDALELVRLGQSVKVIVDCQN